MRVEDVLDAAHEREDAVHAGEDSRTLSDTALDSVYPW